MPGFSLESLEQAQQSLIDCACRLLAHPATCFQVYTNGLEAILGAYPASVCFAVEAAVEQLFTRHHLTNNGFENNSCDINNSRVSTLCRLLSGEPESILQQARKLPDDTHCLKLKVGRRTVAEEIELFGKLDNLLPDSMLVRLDGNRGWSLEQALLFANNIRAGRVAFIEEPVLPDQLERFAADSGLPVALDESLQRRFRENSLSTKKTCRKEPCGKETSPYDAWPLPFSGLQALVVKPSLVGGVHSVRQLSMLAKAHDLDLVLSSSYESNIGLGQLWRLARAYAPDIAPGLNTLSVFDQILLEAPLPYLLPEKDKDRSVLNWQDLEQIWSSKDCLWSSLSDRGYIE